MFTRGYTTLHTAIGLRHNFPARQTRLQLSMASWTISQHFSTHWRTASFYANGGVPLTWPRKYITQNRFKKKNMLVLLFISQNVGTYLYLSCWCFKQLPKKSQKLPSPEGAVLVFQPHESTPNNPELK